MRARSLSFFLVAFIFAASMFSCRKDNDPGDSGHPSPEPFKTEKGSPLGSPVSKTIGAAGGIITSADGKLTVTVPAGAVTSNTEFSIQPISFMLPATEGDTAYRLLPEGIKFPKPVTITYHYNMADVNGGSADLLFGCYHTGEGNWASVPSALNKNNRTVTLTTEHFSDWGITSLLQLKVHKPVLSSLEETDIEILGITMDEEDLLRPLTAPGEIGGDIKSIENWEVIKGGGIVGVNNATPSIATYTPVSPITHGETVEVQVKVKGEMFINDPTLPANHRQISLVVLVGEITLVNDVYMIGSFNGQKISTSNAQAFSANGRILVNASTSSDTSTMTFVLQAVADHAGTYPCGLLTNPGNAQVSVGGELGQQAIALVTEYIHCGPPSYIEYSGASVVIDNWGPIGTYITGSFNGPVYTQLGSNCSPPGRGLSITFRAIRVA